MPKISKSWRVFELESAVCSLFVVLAHSPPRLRYLPYKPKGEPISQKD